MNDEITKSIKDWITRFDKPLNKAGLNEKEIEWFKKGIFAGLQKGIEFGQLAGEQGIEIKLDFNLNKKEEGV
jgi:hypothetical protein